MKTAKNYTTFVVDEFGNFEGIVALRDIMEEIAGELPEKSEILDCVRKKDGSFDVQADLSLTELERQTGIYIPQGTHYHSVAGFIMETLQILPDVGAQVQTEGCLLTVKEVRDHTIEVVNIKVTGENDNEK